MVKETFVGTPYLNIDESKTVDLGFLNDVKGCDTRYNQNGNFAKF